jgi:hypothetical protein
MPSNPPPNPKPAPEKKKKPEPDPKPDKSKGNKNLAPTSNPQAGPAQASGSQTAAHQFQSQPTPQIVADWKVYSTTYIGPGVAGVAAVGPEARKHQDNTPIGVHGLDSGNTVVVIVSPSRAIVGHIGTRDKNNHRTPEAYLEHVRSVMKQVKVHLRFPLLNRHHFSEATA